MALNLLPFVAIAFLWFIGVVRDRIGEGEDRFFASVFLGSGLLFVAMLLSAAAAGGGLVHGGRQDYRPVSTSHLGLRSPITDTLLNIYAMRMAAVFIMSTTTLAVRLRLIPSWLAVVGYFSAAALLLAVGVMPWLELLFPAWVFVFSVHILIVTMRTLSTRSGPLTRPNAEGDMTDPSSMAVNDRRREVLDDDILRRSFIFGSFRLMGILLPFSIVTLFRLLRSTKTSPDREGEQPVVQVPNTFARRGLL